MTIQKTIEMLRARVECITNLVGDKCSYCDDCKLCSAQGNLTEQKECLNMAIKSLEAWEKVKKEIDEATEIHSDGEFYIKNFDVKRIIDKHLVEVRE
jgi:hypothetical protein